MRDAFAQTAFLLLLLTVAFAGVAAASYEIESRPMRLIFLPLAVLTGLAMVTCVLLAIWWEVLAR